MITPSQCRAARALLGMESEDLAQRTAQFHKEGTPVSRSTISRFENSDDLVPYGAAASVTYLALVFEDAGLRFLDGGVVFRDGVRPSK